eukprot:15193399-Alexandrium_andersonii.AAC.1
MSASLVGSEMCIRDRDVACVTGPAGPHVCHCFLPHSCARPRSAARASASVSYTHLTLPTICSV